MLARWTALGIAVAATLALGAGSDQADPPAHTPPDAPAARGQTRIAVSVTRCGTGWTDIAPGQQHFLLQNTDTRSGEVLLTDARTAAVFAEVEPLGPGTTTSLEIFLGSGRYAFRCAMEDEATVVGPTVTVPGSVTTPVAPVLAVTQGDLIEATKNYETYVRGRIPHVIRLTARLQAAIGAGDLSAARPAWLAAHLEYERLGAAYDAFGPLDTAINGTPNGLPDGVKDRDWSGFHRLEYGLWHGESARSLEPPAAGLMAAMTSLRAQFAPVQIAPLDLSLRAHEITENAVQFELTGQSDFGSHSNLATVRANLDGTRAVLAIIRPLLTGRYPQLPTLDGEVARTGTDLDRLRGRTGWPALDALPTGERERINADLSQLSELLAPVASILEPRRPS
jgi:iron uptake system component EfeO